MAVLYTAKATATGQGRDGNTRSSDGVLDHDLAVPTEMGGPGGEGTNPEQLFAAGYAACFHSALQVVARRSRTDLTDSSVTAEVGIGPNGDGGYGLRVDIAARLPHVEQQQAQDLIERADRVCPYSNAVRGNVDIGLRVA